MSEQSPFNLVTILRQPKLIGIKSRLNSQGQIVGFDLSPREIGMDKELMKKCQEWHDKQQYNDIIEALENLPEEERTPEVESELARAYNNIGRESGDKRFFKRALALLLPNEDYFDDDSIWHFRVGYAYFYLEQEGRALPYFQKALELDPGDQETKDLISECQKFLALPLHPVTFAKKTKEAWKEFVKAEPELLRIIKEKKGDWIEDLMVQLKDILDIAFDEVNFGVLLNGPTNELVLSPDGEWTKFFELAYFQSKAPESIKKNWTIQVGRQPKERVDGTYAGHRITGDDIRFWLDQQENGDLSLTVYCDKIVDIHKDKPHIAEGILLRATENVIGELPRMRYIKEFKMVDTPREGLSRPITQLGKDLEALGLELSNDAQTYLEKYQPYTNQNPKDIFDGEWRGDVESGNTSCFDLIQDYQNHYNEAVNALMADKAVPGFFCLPLNNFDGQTSHKSVSEFLHELEATLLEKAGPDAITITGDALGNFCNYVDFIAWDLPAVLEAAVEYFRDHELFWAGFHVFHRDAKTVIMCKAGDEVPSMTLTPPEKKKETIH